MPGAALAPHRVQVLGIGRVFGGAAALSLAAAAGWFAHPDGPAAAPPPPCALPAHAPPATVAAAASAAAVPLAASFAAVPSVPSPAAVPSAKPAAHDRGAPPQAAADTEADRLRALARAGAPGHPLPEHLLQAALWGPGSTGVRLLALDAWATRLDADPAAQRALFEQALQVPDDAVRAEAAARLHEALLHPPPR